MTNEQTFPTQLAAARAGVITPHMRAVAEKEFCDAEFIRDELAAGRLIIPVNTGRKNCAPLGIGRAVTCKINANIGASEVSSDISKELSKLDVAVHAGADAVMDLSTGDSIRQIREAIIAHTSAPLGTVPIYEAMERAKGIEKLTADILFEVIEEQAQQGVDFMTVHCGVLRAYLTLAAKRQTGIVSRGGSLTARWMVRNQQENPLYAEFDRLLEICRTYDVALSLGDGFRPGSLADASDKVQFAELKTLGELVKRAWERDVQVMVEGPGHIPFDEIQMNIEKEIEWCHGAPFYVLGPLVIDCAPGYDHITSAIGGTMAAFYGTSMLCYVTPREHLGLPTERDVRDGVIACKIAAHAADVALKKPRARERDDALSKARFAFDWDTQFSLALDPEQAKSMYDDSRKNCAQETDDYCSMCGPDFCPMRVSKEVSKNAD